MGDVTHLDLKGLAVSCLYLLTGNGRLDFPDSNRAHPSMVVQVSVGFGHLMADGDRGYFPLRCAWDIWQYAVVPVLRSPAMQAALHRWDWTTSSGRDALLSEISGALRLSLSANGYLPGET